ncbi:MAG: FHA domain-containing protein [Deltaproteobacteria bacterium]|nr:FHA domain-containing protein [Deltaproteobacteria bacterium]
MITQEDGTTHRLSFTQDEITIGRHQDNDLVLPAPNISNSQCRIVCRDSRFILVDAGSSNGTYVNGVRANAPTQVRGIDTIGVGPYTLQIDPEVDEVEIKIDTIEIEAEPPTT